MRLLIVSHSTSANFPQSVIVRNLLKTRSLANEDIFLLEEKTTKNNNDRYFNYFFEIEDYSIKTYCHENNAFKSLLFIVKKIIYKFTPAYYKTLYKQKKLSNTIDKICRCENIESVLVFSDFEDVRGGALCKIKTNVKKAVFFTEIPLKGRFSNKPVVNSSLLSKWYGCVDYFFVRECDLPLFKPFTKKVVECEFPLLLRKEASDCNSSKKLLYFGSFHKDIREPDPLFRLMRDYLPDWRLDIYGPTFNDVNDVPANVFFHKPINLDDSNALINKSYGFVDLSNLNTPIKSCKIITYFSYNKPIVNIFGDSYDERLGRQYGAYININDYEDFAKIPNWLEEKKDFSLDKNWNNLFIKFSPEYVAFVILKTFDGGYLND